MGKNSPLETSTRDQYGKDLVSIIIPVYNVEKYIERCISSVLKQTYTNIEIILVDDGSKDKSGKICDIFSQKDSRIKVIHNKNSGVSVARNEGIKLSSGKFLAFVDSDDYLELDAIQNLISKQQEYDYDLVVGKKVIDIKNKRKVPKFLNMELFNEMIADNIFQILTLDAIFPPFAKLYKSDIIKSNKLFFREGITLCEDAIFVFEYFEKIKSVAIIDTVLYNYEIENQNSASRKYHKDFCRYNKIFIQIIEKIVSQSKNNINIKSEFEDYVVNRVVCVLYHYLLANNKIEQVINDIKNTMEEHQQYINFEKLKNKFTKKEFYFLRNKKYKEFVLLWNFLRGYRFLKSQIKTTFIKTHLIDVINKILKRQFE